MRRERPPRRSRVAHLHLRHHRASQGGRGQPSQGRSPGRIGSPGLAGLTSEDRHVQLPADASQRRRRRRHRRAVGRRRLGGHRAEILGEPLLGRRRALGMHVVSIYRRALPLSRRGADRIFASVAPSCGWRWATACAAPVWTRFRRALSAIRVLEFYASTEGNVWLYNVEGRRRRARTAAAVRRRARRRIALVRFDEERQAPARGADGFCVAASTASPARRWGEFPATPLRGSRVIPTPPRPRRRCCATSSSPATPGCAPAI